MSFKNNYLKYLLIIGLSLLATSFIYDFFADDIDIILPIEGIISLIPIWALLLYGIIVAPILEEYSFRSWQKVENKRKYAAPILFLFFVVGSISDVNIISILAVVFVISYWIFFPKIKPLYIVIPTSIAFAIIHLPQDYSSTDFYFILCGFLGGALLLSYVRLRYSLGRAMLFHGLWNFVFMVLIDTQSFYFKQKTFNLPDTKNSISLTRLSIFDHEFNSYSNFGTEKIEVGYGNKEDIIKGLLHNNDSTIIQIETTPFSYYKLNASSKQLNYSEILKKLIPVLKIELDTSYDTKDGFEITNVNKDSFKNKRNVKGSIDKQKFSGQIQSFAKELQGRYGVPFISNDRTSIEILYDGQLSLKSQLKDLEKRHGFKFKKISRKMKIVTVKDK